MADWVATVQQFQTAIVGVIGFAGVMMTIAATARNARVAREAAVEHERVSLRISLIEELRAIADALQRNIADFQRPPLADHEYVVPTSKQTPIFDASLGKLGLLGQEELRKTLNAYLIVQSLRESLMLIGKPFGHEFMWASVPAGRARELQVMFESVLAPVREAIDQLDQALPKKK